MGKEDYKNEKKGHGFLCVPKELLFDNRYKQLTIEAILLYAYMLDRLKLSIENGWKDSDGKVFIYFSLESIMDLLKCSKGKAISTLKELDEKHGIGLIEKKRSGYGKCSRIYPENGQTIADELGCDVETDLDTLYSRDDVDAVIVATPNYLHKEPVVKAAEHGVNVFCEKPIALSYQDCDDMVRACQEHGVIFMAGHVMNFFHGVRHAKKLINDGVIGKVLYCHSARNGWEEQQPTISWKKIREKSGGHLYHHIHELDCVQFLMGGMPEEVTMTGGNVAHQGEAFGDEDDMLFVNMQFSDNRYAVLEWGSAFHWPEHYVLIQGTKGAIKIDMCDCGGTLKIDGKDEHFLVHESQEEDDDRTRIYHSTEMDGAIMYGKPGKKPPMWLHSIMKNEMKYLNGILHGKEVDEEFRPLLTGEAARAAIATADACTRSRFEDRKVKLSEIIG